MKIHKLFFLTLILTIINNQAFSQGTTPQPTTTTTTTTTSNINNFKPPSSQEQILKKTQQALAKGNITIIDNDVVNNQVAISLAQNFTDDEDIMQYLVRIDGNLLKYASFRLRTNKNVVLNAVTQNGLALEYANPILQRDRDIVLAAARENIESLKFISSNAITRDRDFILRILQSK